MREFEIMQSLERAAEPTVYRFTVEVDGREVMRDVEMAWRLSPRAALTKFAGLMERKFSCRDIQVSADWSR